MASKEPPKGGGGQRILHGVNLIVYTLIGIAIVVLINWFTNRHDRRWDLTPNHEYSLSPQSKKILHELSRDVTIYAFDRKGQFGPSRDLLGNYSIASHNVDVEYVDPNRQPGLAKEFGVTSYGTIVVAAGDRHFQAQSADEEGVTNALIRVLKGEKTVCFIQGHGERDLENAGNDGFQDIKNALNNESYKTQNLTLLQKNEIPLGCGIVVVAGPQHDYLPPEIDTIRTYVEDGGRAMFMLDPGVKLPNLDQLLAGWGINVRNDLVIDTNPIARIFGTSPDMPLIIRYGSNAIVQPLTQPTVNATLFPLTRSFGISKSPPSGASPEMLCQTSDASFGVEGFNPSMQKVSFVPGKDIKGPLTVAVADTLSDQGSKGKKTEGRVVTLGTSLVAANAYLGFQGNKDLVMNMVNWLSAEEDLISIRPKATQNQHLNLNQQQMGRLLYLGVFGLPLCIVLVGAGVWWRRRR
jgi:gliding motility-associatede transport system auxiliary component